MGIPSLASSDAAGRAPRGPGNEVVVFSRAVPHKAPPLGIDVPREHSTLRLYPTSWRKFGMTVRSCEKIENRQKLEIRAVRDLPRRRRTRSEGPSDESVS